LQPLFVTGILLVYQVKSTSHECAAVNFINHLNFHPLLKLHSKMFKHPGQQKPVPEIMHSSGVCYASNMLDYDGRKVYLLASIHEISETLIHGIGLVVPLTPWYDVLNDEPEQEPMEWRHVTLLHCLRVFEPWLLTQPLG